MRKLLIPAGVVLSAVSTHYVWACTSSLIKKDVQSGEIVDGQTLQASYPTESDDPTDDDCQQIVWAGGTSTNMKVKTGGLIAAAEDGIVKSATIYKGGEITGKGKFKDIIVESGGRFDIGNLDPGAAPGTGGIAEHTIVKVGGEFYLDGGSAAAEDTTLFGYMEVGRGVAKGTKVGAGGILNISNFDGPTAEAYNTVIQAGGEEIIEGGIDRFATIQAGGVQYIQLPDDLGPLPADAEATAEDTTIEAGGLQIIDQGGVANRAQVRGEQQVQAFGTASEAVIDDGGVQTVYQDGAAHNTLIKTGGLQVVEAGGISALTQIQGGTQNLAGVDRSSTLFSGNQFVQAGGVSNDLIIEGGTQTVQNGGQANRTQINGGVQILASGATASDDQVASGGTVQQYAGATLSNALVAGTLTVMQDGASATGGLTLDGGTIEFAAPTSGYKTYHVDRLQGQGTIDMNTHVDAQEGDLLNVAQAQGNYLLRVHDVTGQQARIKRSLRAEAPPPLPIVKDEGDADFALLDGTADVGAYEYVLQHQGPDWLLVPSLGPDGEPQTTDTVDASLSLAQSAGAIWYGQLQQLYRRLGELRSNPMQDGAWVRTYMQRTRLHPAAQSTALLKQTGLEVGMDHRWATPDGDWYLGAVLGGGEVKQSFQDAGSGRAKPWSMGLYGSWLHPQGWYGAVVARYNAMTQMLDTQASGFPTTASYRTTGYTLSAEFGKRIDLGEGAESWWLEPALELTRTHEQGVSYRTSYGTEIHQDNGNSLLGRAEVRVGKLFTLSPTQSIEPFVGLGLVRQFRGQAQVEVAGEPFTSTTAGTRGILSAGVAAQFSQNMHLYADVAYGKGTRYEQPWAVNVGVRVAW